MKHLIAIAFLTLTANVFAAENTAAPGTVIYSRFTQTPYTKSVTRGADNKIVETPGSVESGVRVVKLSDTECRMEKIVIKNVEKIENDGMAIEVPTTAAESATMLCDKAVRAAQAI